MSDDLGKQLASGSWQPIGVVVEGDAIDVEGINPWQHRWRSLDATVGLPHPAYPSQRHRMEIYQIKTGDVTVVFAAGELSANVWGFFVPEAKQRPQAFQQPLDGRPN